MSTTYRSKRSKRSKLYKRSMRGGQATTTKPMTTTTKPVVPPATVYLVNGQLTQTPPSPGCEWKAIGSYKLGAQASMQQGSSDTAMLYLGGNKWTDMGASNESTTSIYFTKKDTTGIDRMTNPDALPLTIPPASGAQYYTFKLENRAKTSSCVFRIDYVTDGSKFRTPNGVQLVFERKNGKNPTLQSPLGTPSFNGEVYTLSYALCKPGEMPAAVVKYVPAP